MKVVHLLRKPMSEKTVAANTLKHGTGGLNIDASRVKGGPSSGGSISGASALGQGSGWNAHANRTTQIDRSMSSGRWPANVILQHLDGCLCAGIKKVGTGEVPLYGDGDYTETVANWICEPGCPVARLDNQSGRVTNPASEGGASRFYKQVGGKKNGA